MPSMRDAQRSDQAATDLMAKCRSALRLLFAPQSFSGRALETIAGAS